LPLDANVKRGIRL